MELSLSGKRAVVTAGGGGIGRVIARTFVEAGASVHVCDVDEAALEDAKTEIPALGFTVADVSLSADVDRLFDAALGWMGGLDVLVNNAGISGPTKPVEEVTDEEWNATLGINVTGGFYCVRRAVPLFVAAGGGRIVNLSSTAGRLGFPLRAPYSTAKYAVIGMTETLAMELGRKNINVNAILPGAVDGERFRRICSEQAAARGMTFEEYLPMQLHNVSLQTTVSQEEIAAAALFLCSEAGRHISGQSIGVCGNFESLRGPYVVQAEA